jgi:hypothetical protein
VGSKLNSQLKGRGFESHPIQDGNGFKTMPGLIIVPNPVKSSKEGKKKSGKPNGAHQKIQNSKVKDALLNCHRLYLPNDNNN